jgi:hypothetical protein
MIIMQNVDSVMLPRLVTAALAELLLHTGSALEWLAPDVLAAKKEGADYSVPFPFLFLCISRPSPRQTIVHELP